MQALSQISSIQQCANPAYAVGARHLCLQPLLPKPGSCALPRIQTCVFTKAVLAMFWVRLRTLNAMVESAGYWYWKQWLHTEVPSGDSVGRVCALLDRG